MSTDKELADRIVALGVGEKDPFRPDMYTWLFHSVRYEADKWVRDWRVAGAMLLKCREKEYVISVNPDGVVMVFTGRDEPYDCCESDSTEWPLAINEACCEALEE